MSHELDDNIRRRQAIVLSIPKRGLTQKQFLRHIMMYGYNLRGAQNKAKELRFLGLVKENKGKIYAAT